MVANGAICYFLQCSERARKYFVPAKNQWKIILNAFEGHSKDFKGFKDG